MSNTESKGYPLADGSWSSEYKIGDKFIVTDCNDAFSENSVVELYFNDGFSPIFKLISGRCEYKHAGGEAGAFEPWYNLSAYKLSTHKEEPTQESDVEHNSSGKATIYYTDGTTYTQTNVDYCINPEGTDEFTLVLTPPIKTKLLADVYMESESIKLNTQHISGIVFKSGSYEEVYKLKPTFQSTYNVYDKKNREKSHSQKLSGSSVELRSKELGISDYHPKAGDYVNKDALTMGQVVKFFIDCLQEGMHEGESFDYINNSTLSFCGWHLEDHEFFYTSGFGDEFNNDVTDIYMEK